MASCSDCGGIVLSDRAKIVLRDILAGGVYEYMLESLAPRDFEGICEIVRVSGGAPSFRCVVTPHRPAADAVKFLQACNGPKLRLINLKSAFPVEPVLQEIDSVLSANATIRKVAIGCYLAPGTSLDFLYAIGSLKADVSMIIGQLPSFEMETVDFNIETHPTDDEPMELSERALFWRYDPNKIVWEDYVLRIAVFALPRLTNLQFAKRSPKRAREFERAMGRMAELTRLREAKITHNNSLELGTAFATFVRNSESVRAVHYGGSINDAIIQEFALAIETSVSLQYLTIEAVPTKENVEMLARAIEKSSSIQWISIDPWRDAPEHETGRLLLRAFEKAKANRAMLAMMGALGPQARGSVARRWLDQTGDNAVQSEVLRYLLPKE